MFCDIDFIMSKLEMSKWVSTREPTRLITGSSRVGWSKIQFFFF